MGLSDQWNWNLLKRLLKSNLSTMHMLKSIETKIICNVSKNQKENGDFPFPYDHLVNDYSMTMSCVFRKTL